MARTDTIDELYRPMMGRPSVSLPYCATCGRAWPIEEHHAVFRSAGAMYDEDGEEVEKPTITLCGLGNNLKDADGRYFCHGLAHARMLHFRWGDRGWEWLRTDAPTRYIDALEMDGWKELGAV